MKKLRNVIGELRVRLAILILGRQGLVYGARFLGTGKMNLEPKYSRLAVRDSDIMSQR